MDNLILGSIIFNVTLQVLVIHELLALVVSIVAKSGTELKQYKY